MSLAQRANGRLREARDSIERWIKLAPISAQAHFQLAATHRELGDTDQMRRLIEHALELDPKYLPAQLAVGNLDLRSGRLPAASKRAQALQARHANTVGGYMLEGDVYMALDPPDKAIRSYDAAFERRPSSRLLVKRAAAQRGLGRATAANQELAQWLKTKPKDSEVRFVLASAYQEDGRTPEAIAEYKYILEQQPNNAIAMNNLAWLYHLQHDER